MKILQLCYEFPPVGGGASRVVAGLSRELANRGHDVHVVTMAYRQHRGTEEWQGVTVHRVPAVRLSEFHCTMPEVALYVARAAGRLRHLVRGGSFDINHTHFILPDGLLSARLRAEHDLPYVITAHGSDVPGYNPHRLQVAHALFRRTWLRTARGAATIVCPSRSIQALVQRRDAALPTTLIPYGIDAGRYRADLPRVRRILVVTRLLRRKGVQYLFRALQDLPLEHEIHVVGDGPYAAELRRAASGIGPRVVFHGWLDNDSERLAHLYETSDIFVLTSERENFPVALMEAMVAGLAIITTRGTGCAEVVGDDGVLVAPRDPVELRSAILELTRDPARCRALGRRARLRAETVLSWEAVADRYLELYESHRQDPAKIGSGAPS